MIQILPTLSALSERLSTYNPYTILDKRLIPPFTQLIAPWSSQPLSAYLTSSIQPQLEGRITSQLNATYAKCINKITESSIFKGKIKQLQEYIWTVLSAATSNFIQFIYNRIIRPFCNKYPDFFPYANQIRPFMQKKVTNLTTYGITSINKKAKQHVETQFIEQCQTHITPKLLEIERKIQLFATEKIMSQLLAFGISWGLSSGLYWLINNILFSVTSLNKDSILLMHDILPTLNKIHSYLEFSRRSLVLITLIQQVYTKQNEYKKIITSSEADLKQKLKANYRLIWADKKYELVLNILDNEIDLLSKELLIYLTIALQEMSHEDKDKIKNAIPI